ALDLPVDRRPSWRHRHLATAPVTPDQFVRFQANFASERLSSRPDPNAPITGMRFYEAAAYCNRLSALEGLPPTEWCYEPNPQGQYAVGMKVATNSLQRTGYRLPTEAEWEDACRAGTVTH